MHLLSIESIFHQQKRVMIAKRTMVFKRMKMVFIDQPIKNLMNIRKRNYQ